MMPCLNALLSEGIYEIALNRPPVNVLDMAGLDEMVQAIQALPETASALLIRGEGKAFCAGVDVADHTEEKVGEMIPLFGKVTRLLLDLPVPAGAAIHGACLGGGLEIALACDFIFVTPDAKMGQPEIRLGVFPPAACAILPRRIGWSRAMEVILRGETFSGEDAMRMGLATRLFPEEEIHEKAREFLSCFTRLSRAALREAKKAMMAAMDQGMKEGMAMAEKIYLGSLMSTRDAKEGIRSFMEKRSPTWEHR